MKTILLAPLPPPNGGIARWTERLLQSPLKQEWTLGVVDERTIGRGVFGTANRRSYWREVGRCIRIWRDLIHTVRDKEVRIVHSCIPAVATSMLRESVCACIAKIASKKFIIHFHCTVPNIPLGKWGTCLLQHLCNRADHILVLNEPSERYVKTFTHTPVTILPNFVRENEVVPTRVVNKELKTVVYVGGMVTSKGVQNLMNVAREMPDITFRFVGEGDDFAPYVAEQHLTNVVLVGSKDKLGVQEELQKADVFAFLSHFYGEGFSCALVEAMAAGLPCLVTDWAANADMVAEQGGRVVPVDDSAAAVQALNSMRSYEVRQQQSQANIAKVTTNYTDCVVLDQLVDIYEDCIKQKAK